MQSAVAIASLFTSPSFDPACPCTPNPRAIDGAIGCARRCRANAAALPVASAPSRCRQRHILSSYSSTCVATGQGRYRRALAARPSSGGMSPTTHPASPGPLQSGAHSPLIEATWPRGITRLRAKPRGCKAIRRSTPGARCSRFVAGRNARLRYGRTAQNGGSREEATSLAHFEMNKEPVQAIIPQQNVEVPTPWMS